MFPSILTFVLLVLTGVAFIGEAAVTLNGFELVLLIIIAIFYAVGLYTHFAQLPSDFQHDLQHEGLFTKKSIAIIVTGVIGTVVTFFLSVDLSLGPVVASGLVGVIGAVCLPAKLTVVAYTAAFAGMSSTYLLTNYFLVALVGLLVGLLSIACQPGYGGIGGKLGTIAACAVLLITLIFKM